jgi:hypothetical protein
VASREIEAVDQFLPWLAPLITPATFIMLLTLGIISLCIASIEILAIILVQRQNDNQVMKWLFLISGILQVWMIGPNTFFGVFLIGAGLKWTGALLNKTGKVFEKKDIDTLLIGFTIYNGLLLAFLIFMLPGIYILPVEFLNDEDLFWIRENIWNFFYAIDAIFGAIVVLLAFTAWFSIKEMKGWKKLSWITCVLLLFGIPLGPYISGVVYRNRLRK